ncbi:MAG: DNA-directed RNA polymerase subunit A'' [Candidatus Aenigmarchaeota archaeon]|nr:DNA-directed RNA polymerase subunit A'' [Candidatus Aenigmarchaeota archaeon]
MTELPKKLLDEAKAYMGKNKIPESKREKFLEGVKTLYKKAMYFPEEPIGVVTAQSLSEPATQMSTDGKEQVIVKRNGMVRIAPIGEFVDMLMEEFGKQEKEGWEVCDISGRDIFVPSITQEEKIEWKRVVEASRHDSPPTLLRIHTLSGRKITATDSHSFVIRKNNSIVPVAGTELAKGERIPVLSYLPENCLQSIETKGLVKEKFAKKPIPQSIELNKTWGWLFGAYLAEGNATKFYVSLSNTNPQFLSRVREFADSLGFTYNEYDNDRGFALGHDIRINSSQLSQLLEKTCNTGSSSKQLPFFAYSASLDFVSGLLRGYFDGDGNVSVDRGVLRVSSSSEKLIDGVALLLTRFRIFSRKSKKKEFSLSIPYKYAGSFQKHIGFTIPSKAEKLNALVQLFKENKDKYEDFIEMTGGFGSLLTDLSRKLGLPTRYVNSITNRQKIGKVALCRHIQNFEETARTKNINIQPELMILKQMRDANVVWDEIAEIERVPPSGKKVYDFSVEGNETFTTFEGIVTHNTMRTYHFAGTAGIQVTLGLPRMLEIFDARKEPKTPTMKVYIMKEHQPLESVKKIAEDIKEVKIKDVVFSTLIDLSDVLIKCTLDIQKMKSLECDPKVLAKSIKIRNTAATIEGDSLMLRPKKKDISVLHKLKYTLLESHLKGIKGISQVIVSKEDGEWVINTLGSSLKKVFAIEGVDFTRTISNNIFEMNDALGIEAGREAIVQQAVYTMSEQGLIVDMRYILLLADLMSAEGEIRAIGRYGISGKKASPLVRASFEETKKHLTNASIKGETDPLLGTVENIMLNQVAPIGTGSYQLVGRIPAKGIKKPRKRK